MPAYNHEQYIAEAIESVLMQKVAFEYEIVIGEDCSTDNTRAIAVRYAKRFPGRVRLLLHEKNLGIYENDRSIIEACSGSYIAWLEADDYWTSPDKLQKQVEFLDMRQDYTACFHRARCVGPHTPSTWQGGPPEVKPYYTIDDLLKNGHFIPSCTAVFRSELVRAPAEWMRLTPFLETTHFARFALRGKIGFIDEELAVFRYHGAGIYGKATNIQNAEAAINAHLLLGKHLHLSKRESYRSGLAAKYLRLSKEFSARGQPFPALSARCKAFWLSQRRPRVRWSK